MSGNKDTHASRFETVDKTGGWPEPWDSVISARKGPKLKCEWCGCDSNGGKVRVYHYREGPYHGTCHDAKLERDGDNEREKDQEAGQ